MKNTLKFLNPMSWLRVMIDMITILIRGVLAGFGIGQLPLIPKSGGSQVSDVEDAAKLAAEQEAAVDTLRRQRMPGDLVHAYASADSATRSMIDLSVLDNVQQDWLMRLSDAELVMLAGSGVNACARSLQNMKVMPDFRKLRVQETETAPRILAVPSEDDLENTRRQHVREQYEMLRRSLTEPQMKPILA